MKNLIQGVKGKIEEVQNEVQRKIEEIEGKVQRKIQKVEDNFVVVSSANGWNNFVKANQLVASLRGSAAEVLQGIPSDKLKDLTTIENALEARFRDSHLTQFYRTELKTRRQKPGESLQVLAANVERLMSLAYAECPQDVRDSLAAQYFVDAIRDEDTQHATRKLNEITVKDSYPLSRIDDTLDALSGNQWFSTLDLKSGYWHVEIQPEDKEKTAFTTGQGLWQFKVMPFGLCNGPATFETFLETLLRGLTSEGCLVYIDDIIIVGRTFEEHLNNIRKVFQRLQKADLKLSPKKYRFFRKEVSYLGHIMSVDGVKTDPEKTKAVFNWPRPETVHDLRSFLGLCTYYSRFVRNFSARSNFNQTEECEKSFNSRKQALITSPVLIYPRTDKEFILDTDASNEGIGAVLSRRIGNEECVITYFSKNLGKPERNYCVTRKELLAIVKSIEHFHHYLYGRKFLLRTDHDSLRWLLNFREPEGQKAR
ncbi:Retrovirus-related Pol polyprotein from transposon 297 [Araneus ventricosus]|uniref:Retrovirus-related Pol polyprotein from transposon 297 n=1 Tax=Araneus ventricosus TaxID=182803 RepID=A0A4Y2C8D6_ARAVE|nr:Retrovirus-related Pol polyprotein from transposon 297 [Araneus ventricosus]